MSDYIPRTTAPDKSDKRWINTAYGGYNRQIAVTSAGSVIPNCTGYVHGRWMEIAGLTSETALCSGNANRYYTYNDGYERSAEPTLGAVICFSGTYGHVAVVEEIAADGSYIRCSESDYGGARFSFRTRYRSNNWILSGSSLKFQGFIRNPYVTDGSVINPDDPDYPPEPAPSRKNIIKLIARKIIKKKEDQK